MKKILLTLLLTVLFSPGIASATAIDVFQDDLFLGSIDAYSGMKDADSNYAPANTSVRNPIHGPTSFLNERQIYFYERLNSSGESMGFTIVQKRIFINE